MKASLYLGLIALSLLDTISVVSAASPNDDVDERVLGDGTRTTCESCIPAAVFDAPGIGFDLTLSYGTSAAHFANGTVVDLAKVPGSKEYVMLMRRLSVQRRPQQPDSWQKVARWINQFRGLPASPDVGYISDLISNLKTASEEVLGAPVDSVVISLPTGLKGLPPMHLTDALKHVGLNATTEFHPVFRGHLNDINAIYAGNGQGTCEAYSDYEECLAEERDLPWETVYTIRFTNDTLYTAISLIGGAFYAPFVPESTLIDREAGLHRMKRHGSAEGFWSHVRSKLVELPAKRSEAASSHPITKVILAGELAGNEDFLKAVGEALTDLSKKKDGADGEAQPILDFDPAGLQLLNSAVDPTFAAARGGAWYARQRRVSRLDCDEPVTCEEKRDLDRLNTKESEQETLRDEL